MTAYKIIFYPGSHGSYLEFILNKCIYGPGIEKNNPLKPDGTSHYSVRTSYIPTGTELPYFKCMHDSDDIKLNEKFIKINFDPSDDVQIILLHVRRGSLRNSKESNTNIDLNQLHNNTYYKLYNHPNKQLACTIDNINRYSNIESYFYIKDDSWPEISSVDDFYQLPQHIINECKDSFNYSPFYLSEKTPDTPKWVLRSIYKSWFSNMERPSEYMKKFDNFTSVYNLSLDALYNYDNLINEFKNIQSHFNINLDLNYFSKEIHDKFVELNPYVNSAHKCRNIIDAIKNQIDIPICLGLFEEGYVSYVLDKEFNYQIPDGQDEFFKSTKEIVKQVQHHRNVF